MQTKRAKTADECVSVVGGKNGKLKILAVIMKYYRTLDKT